MRNWRTVSDVAIAVILLACCMRVSQRFEQLKRRFRSIRSPLIGTPAYRILFLVVVIGVLLIAVLPEAAFVLPMLDAIGWDIATIFVAFELGQYMSVLARVVGIPTLVTRYGRGAAEGVRHCRDIIHANPILWSYACMWLMIWVLSFLGRMRPRVQI